MGDEGSHQSWVPGRKRGLVGCQRQCNGTNTVDESHIGQQSLCTSCVAADAIWSSARVKPVQRLHEMLNPYLHVCEERDVWYYELRVHVKLCNI